MYYIYVIAPSPPPKEIEDLFKPKNTNAFSFFGGGGGVQNIHSNILILRCPLWIMVSVLTNLFT